jgi:transposase-like protein
MIKKKKAPGKSFREGVSLLKIMKMFPDDATAEKWFIETRWPDGVACVKCGSMNVAERKRKEDKPRAYRCRDCRKDFSVKTGTLMHNSPLGFQTWAVAIYLLITNLKGVSSMKLHRDLEITQKSAWHLAHRIRETWKDNIAEMDGTLEVDETFVGGKEKNKHNSKRSHIQGPSGKAVVVGMKARETNRVVAKPVPARTKEQLQGFIGSHASQKAMVYTDDHRSYIGLPFEHEM